MMRKQNVQNVHDKGCSNQGKHETFKREDKREMKEKPTKAKKKGRTIRAFKRDISLWLFCVPGVILTFIFSYIPMYGVQIAFRRFNATAGITKRPWVGMYYLRDSSTLHTLLPLSRTHWSWVCTDWLYHSRFRSSWHWCWTPSAIRDTGKWSRPSPTRRTSFPP